MNRCFSLVALLFNLIFANAQTFTTKPAWSENFSSWGRRPLRDWDYLKGVYPGEEQFYTDSVGNVFLKNGYLHIKATADKRNNRVCSSGRVSTKDYKSFLYGKLEVRAKIPVGKGVFPAIWMLREDHGTKWPIGEIDIMEYIECFKKAEFATTIHLTNREHGYESNPIRFAHSRHKKADMTKFHIYGLEWTPNELTFTLDYKPYYTLKKDDAEFWPFDDPYILIFNVAYGSWGAQCGTDDSIFPKEMLVDWIRYYPMLTYNNEE